MSLERFVMLDLSSRAGIAVITVFDRDGWAMKPIASVRFEFDSTHRVVAQIVDLCYKYSAKPLIEDRGEDAHVLGYLKRTLMGWDPAPPTRLGVRKL